MVKALPEIKEQGLLAVITTDHDFDRVVARKVFVGANDRMRIELWFTDQREQLLKYDREADGSFDSYGYSLETYEVEVRSLYS